MKKPNAYRYITWLLSLAILLTGCSTPNLENYRDNKPTLNVREFFSGKLNAHGIVKNRKGVVIRYFNADINATWDSNGHATLNETFVFDDGEKQQRIWILKPENHKSYIATANDVVGESIMRTAGNALFLKYVLTIPYKGKTINVNVVDRMYMVNQKTLINESVMTKFGFDVGYITLVITKY